jgi:hypothetical protein
MGMAKQPSKEIELHPDAWARFERAAEVVGKSPPQHKPAKKTEKRLKTKAGNAKKRGS